MIGIIVVLNDDCVIGKDGTIPFAGAATTGLAALKLQRRFVGIELNPAYAAMARRRLEGDSPLFDVPPRTGGASR